MIITVRCLTFFTTEYHFINKTIYLKIYSKMTIDSGEEYKEYYIQLYRRLYPPRWVNTTVTTIYTQINQ